MAPGLHRVRRQPTQHRNAAEALLRRLGKQGDIPSVSTLVDVGNLVSIRYAMPVAVFDLADIAGSVTVRLSAGHPKIMSATGIGELHPERS
ncbi:MAG: hypothetical protein H0T40_04815 [Geodermatophilaceae bacterium]|nr:hypothetical protein [Geodermatophilaceae bacterium]